MNNKIMSVCINCGCGNRIVSFCSKTTDCNSVTIGEKEHYGYVPSGMNVGSGDYLDFELCLNCGTVQGKWPVPQTELETQPPKTDDRW